MTLQIEPAARGSHARQAVKLCTNCGLPLLGPKKNSNSGVILLQTSGSGPSLLHKLLPFRAKAAHNAVSMQIHASCAARQGHGVLLLGPPGSGKSDLVLRLLDQGFTLVADDRVDIEDGIARPPAALAGLLEVRGLGLMRLPHETHASISLAVTLDRAERLPQPEIYAPLGIPLVHIDPQACSAPNRVALALDCVLGRATQLAGAFA